MTRPGRVSSPREQARRWTQVPTDVEAQLNEWRTEWLAIALTDNGMAGPTGFEPAISSVTGWHVWPLHHGPAEVTRWRSIA